MLSIIPTGKKKSNSKQLHIYVGRKGERSTKAPETFKNTLKIENYHQFRTKTRKTRL